MINFEREIIVSPPERKEGRNRKVQLAKKIVGALKLMEKSGHAKAVFLTKGSIEERWAKVRTIGGINDKFHDLCKNISTLLQVIGLSPRFCKKPLGHKTKEVNEIHHSGHPVEVVKQHLEFVSDIIWKGGENRMTH